MHFAVAFDQFEDASMNDRFLSAQSAAFLCCVVVMCQSGFARDKTGPHVAPADEVVIIRPEADSRGLPTPVIRKQSDSSSALVIETPPTILFHRYYYTGNRDFQGPMLPGGASVIVAKHPKTGQQVAVEAELLPGAPRIFYTREGIRYVYASKSIFVSFGGLLCSDTKVSVKGKSLSNKFKTSLQCTFRPVGEFTRRTGIPDSIRTVHSGKEDAALGLADRIRGTGEFIVRPISGIWNSTPIGGFFEPDGLPTQTVERLDGGIIDELEGTAPTLR